MPKSILDPDFRYVAAKDQTVEHLRARFKYHREQIEKRKQEQEAKVKPIVRLKNGTR